MKKQRISHELENIVPFNRYLFKSCYYHQLIAAFAHYGVEESYVIENFVDLYDFDEKNDLPLNKTLQVYGDKELEFVTGLKLTKRRNSKNFVREIVNSLDQNIPVIVAVDCFCLDYRQDAFRKKHLTHFILVYGYGWDKRQFLINDHYYFNSYVYSPRWVDFGMLENAWQAYRAGRADKSGYSLIKVTKFKEKEPMPDGYMSFLRAHRGEVLRSLACVGRMKTLFFKVFRDKNFLGQKLEGLMDFIGAVRPKKEMQKNYFHTRDIRLQEITDRILDNYIFVYGILIRFKVAKIFDELSIGKCENRVEEIAELESRLHAYYCGEWHA